MATAESTNDPTPPNVPVEPKRRGRPPKDPAAHAAKLAAQAEAEARGETVEPVKRRGRQKNTEKVNGIVFRGSRQAGKLLVLLSGMLREPTSSRIAYDAQVIGGPEGSYAIAACAEKLAERNAKFASAIIRMDENAGVAGAGTALLIAVVVPILINHEIISLPGNARELLGMSPSAQVPPDYPGEDEMERDEPNVEPETETG